MDAASGGPSDSSSLCFTHSAFAHCSLPRRPTADQKFEAANGRWALRLQAGALPDAGGGPITQPLPFGAKARLLLTVLCTRSLRDPEFELAPSMGSLLKSLGIDRGGRDRERMTAQVLSLFATTITISFDGGIRFRGRPFASAAPLGEGRCSAWPILVRANPAFLASLTDRSAVPLNLDALARLRHSALAIDSYCWLAVRLRRLPANRRVRVSWNQLARQFGGYRSVAEFRREFVLRLPHILAVYPEMRVEVGTGLDEGYLVLWRSPPPIPEAASGGFHGPSDQTRGLHSPTGPAGQQQDTTGESL